MFIVEFFKIYFFFALLYYKVKYKVQNVLYLCIMVLSLRRGSDSDRSAGFSYKLWLEGSV